MDVFEHLVADVLWKKGFWVRTSVWVDLKKSEKVAIGRTTSPRWALDILAYNCRSNLLLVVECKSYLDSKGVGISSFDGSSKKAAKAFKLFNEPTTWAVVSNRLKLDLMERDACRPEPHVQLALACGKVKSDEDRLALRAHFQSQNWQLFDDHWIKSEITAMADLPFENNAAVMTSKLLLRTRPQAQRKTGNRQAETEITVGDASSAVCEV